MGMFSICASFETIDVTRGCSFSSIGLARETFKAILSEKKYIPKLITIAIPKAMIAPLVPPKIWPTRTMMAPSPAKYATVFRLLFAMSKGYSDAGGSPPQQEAAKNRYGTRKNLAAQSGGTP